MWLAAPPVERVFLYRLLEFAPDATLSALRDSLSQALRAFYPLAGRLRLRLTHGTTNRYDLLYRPGDGVTFTVAEYDIDVDDLATDDPREIAKIAPPLPEDGAVLALQATLLSARRGLALGVTVHHAACDGAASTHLLRTWAAACAAGAQAPPPPVIDRTIIRDRKDLHDMFTTKPSTDHSSSNKEFFKESPDAGHLVATFTLSKEQLQSVKNTVAREAERRGVPPPRCSSNVATFGFVWHCHCRSKAEEEEAGGRRTYLYFPVDHRARLEPSVHVKFLGNCVGPCFASAPKKQVAEGVLAACAAVAAGIEEAVRGGSGYWNASGG